MKNVKKKNGDRNLSVRPPRRRQEDQKQQKKGEKSEEKRFDETVTGSRNEG